MRFRHDGDDAIVLVDTATATDTAAGAASETRLATYVIRPTEPQVESPRPYALLRTRGGVDVTAYRPADHVWHKGLSLALPVVGTHNFWGGPTYVHPDGYMQLPNNGAQVHRGAVLSDADGVARCVENLDFVSEQGAVVLTETRTLTARAVDERTWALTWHSALRNVSDAPLGFGSPTSKGRPNAGYAGIFWRGPASFTGGAITGPDGELGDAARGGRAPWLAYAAPDASAGILMLNASAPERAHEPWFARSAEYAGLNPAPFFHAETVVGPGETITLAAVLVIGTIDVHTHAGGAGAALVAELRHHSDGATP